MATVYGKLTVRPTIGNPPMTEADLLRWAKDFHQTFSTTIWDQLQKAIPFKVNNSGTASFGAADTSKAVTFDGREDDTSYQIDLSPNWNAVLWWSAKTVTGFTINASAAPGGGGGTVDWGIKR